MYVCKIELEVNGSWRLGYQANAIQMCTYTVVVSVRKKHGGSQMNCMRPARLPVSSELHHHTIC